MTQIINKTEVDKIKIPKQTERRPDFERKSESKMEVTPYGRRTEKAISRIYVIYVEVKLA